MENKENIFEKAIVIEAKKNFSMNKRFWHLIKAGRFPYKAGDGGQIEVKYLEAVKSLKGDFGCINWLTDREISGLKLAVSISDPTETYNILKKAQEETNNLLQSVKD